MNKGHCLVVTVGQWRICGMRGGLGLCFSGEEKGCYILIRFYYKLSVHLGKSNGLAQRLRLPR